MSTSIIDATPIGVRFEASRFHIELRDGREIAAPLRWFPRLERASAAQRMEWRLIAGGVGIHWPQIDEDIEIEGLLRTR